MNKYDKLGKMAFQQHRLFEGMSAGTLPPRSVEELGKMLIKKHKLEHKILAELKKVM
jgi:hypothetical protein